MKAWLVGSFLHATREAALFVSPKRFFSICLQRCVKVSAKKSVLFSQQIMWCGRLIDKDGVRCDLRRLSGFLDTKMTKNASELFEFLYCLQLISDSIPDFATCISSLREILEDAYHHSRKRATNSIQNIGFAELSWGPTHMEAFLDLREQLRNAVKMSHQDQKMTLCLYKDASDFHSAAVVTKCKAEELDKPVADQRHKSLEFFSNALSHTLAWWSTFYKETFAIYQTFAKLGYTFAAEEDVHVLSDKEPIVYNPVAAEPELGRHVFNKVQRWAPYL